MELYFRSLSRWGYQCIEQWWFWVQHSLGVCPWANLSISVFLITYKTDMEIVPISQDVFNTLPSHSCFTVVLCWVCSLVPYTLLSLKVPLSGFRSGGPLDSFLGKPLTGRCLGSWSNPALLWGAAHCVHGVALQRGKPSAGSSPVSVTFLTEHRPKYRVITQSQMSTQWIRITVTILRNLKSHYSTIR